MADILSMLRSVSTSTVSDALDRLGIAGQCHALRPVFQGVRVCGPAFTVKYLPVGPGGGTVGDFLDDVPPGSIIAIDNNGRTDCTVWGDIMTSVAAKRGIAGTAINGICRDVDRSRAMNYPIFSISHWMRTGKDRVRLAGINVPIDLGQVAVSPEDILLGDDNGIVAIPASRASGVAEVAITIEETENKIRDAASEGMPLVEARKKFGYHALQRKQAR
jgi:4-hydroxy-4-methyl-2-oxoglutarate aldolase